MTIKNGIAAPMDFDGAVAALKRDFVEWSPKFLSLGATRRTFFPNEKRAFFHDATTRNSFLRIKKNGEVKISHRCMI